MTLAADADTSTPLTSRTIETGDGSPKPFSGFRILDVGVWLALSIIVFLTVSHHEPWADEAQSWLLARDLGWFKLIFSELRFEGHPGLWHTILWIGIHTFGIPYSALGYVGAVFAVAGLAVLVFLAPFPRPLRYLIGTSFFFLYQYSAIARSYTLLPLFAFSSAYLFQKRRTLELAISLSLLSHVSAHGTIIAFALAVAYALQVRKEWPQLECDQRRQLLFCTAIYTLAVGMVVIILFPPKVATVASSDAATFTLTQHIQKTIWGLLQAIYPSGLLAVAVLLLVAVWCYECRALIPLLLAVGGNAVLFGFLRGALQHVGIMLVAVVAVLWSSWPSEPVETKSRPLRLLHRTFVVVLCLLFVMQSRWSYIAIHNDWRYQYSGAPDAAAFLKSHNMQSGCIAFNYWAIAVQPYFDHNIFLNFGGPESPAFFHNSQEFRERTSTWDPRVSNPNCIVVSQEINSGADLRGLNSFAGFLGTKGYSVVHLSQGSTFFRDSAGERQVLLIFARNDQVK